MSTKGGAENTKKEPPPISETGIRGLRIYKIGILGDGGVGKSAVTSQFVGQNFLDYYDPTIEDAYQQQAVIDGEASIIDILDTARKDEFAAMRDKYIRCGDGFIICYSVTDRHSFQAVLEYRKLITRVRLIEDIPLVLIANKIDLEDQRTVTTEEGENLAIQLGCPFYETSATLRQYIDDAFYTLIREIRGKEAQRALSNGSSSEKIHSSRRTWCPSVNNIDEDDQLNQMTPPLFLIPKCAETDYILHDEEFQLNNQSLITSNTPKRRTSDELSIIVKTPKCSRDYKNYKRESFQTPKKQSIRERLEIAKEEFEENYNFLQVEKKFGPKCAKFYLTYEENMLKDFQNDLLGLCEDFCAAADNLSKENTDKNEEFADSCQRCDKLSTQLGELAEEFKKHKLEKNSEIEQLKLTNEAQQQHTADIECELEQQCIRAKNRELELIMKIDEQLVTEESLRASQNQCEQLQQTISNLQVQNKPLSDVKIKIECHTDEIATKIENNGETNNLNKQIIEFQSENELLKANIFELNDKLKNLNAERDKLQNEYDQLSTEVMDNLQEIDDLKQKICNIETNGINQMKNDNETLLQQEIADLELALNGVNKMYADDQATLVNLQTENRALDVALKAEQKQYSNLLVEHDNLKQFKFKCEILEITVKENEQTLRKFEHDYTEVQQKLDALTNDHKAAELKNKTETNELSDKCIKLQEKLVEIQNENESLGKTIKIKCDELDDLKSSKEIFLATLQSELDAVRFENKVLSEEISTHQQNATKITELKSTVENLKIECNEKCENYQSRIDALINENNRLENDFIKNNGIIENYQKNLHENEQTLSKFEYDYTEVKQKLDELTNEHEAAELKHKTETSELSDKCIKLQEKLLAMQNENESFGEMIKIKCDELDDLNASRKNYSVTLQSELDAVRSKNKKLSEEISTNQQNASNITELQSTVENLKIEYNEKCENYQSKIDALINENKRLENDFIKNSEIKQKFDELINEHKAAELKQKTETNELSDKCIKLQEKLVEMQNENESLGKTIKIKCDELDDLKSFETLQSDLDAIRSENKALCEELQSTVENLKVECNEKSENYQSKIDALINENKRLEDDFIKISGTIENYQKVLQQTEDNCNSLRNTLTELQTKIKTINENNETLKLNNLALNREVCDLNGMINELETARLELEIEYSRKNSQMETIEELSSIEVYSDKIHCLEQELIKTEAHRNDLEQENIHLKVNLEHVNDLKEQISNLKNDLLVKQSNLEQLINDRNEFMRKIELLVNQLETYKDNHDQLMNDLKCAKELIKSNENDNQLLHDKFLGEKSKLQNENASIKSQYETIKNENSSLKSKYEMTENDLKNCQQEILNLKRSNFVMANFETELIVAQKKIQQLEKEIQEKHQFNLNYAEKDAKIRDLENRLKHANNERDELRQTIKNENSSLKSKCEITENDLKNCQQEILDLKRSNFVMANYQTELTVAQKKIQQLEKEMNEKHKHQLNQSYAEKEAKIRDLENRLEHANNERDELRQLQNNDRKSRRHSTHDAMRINSKHLQDVWPCDAGTQTDPSDQLCACTDMAAKIKTLKREKMAIDSQFYTYKMKMEINPWQQEKLTYEKRLQDSEQKNLTLRKELNRLQNEIQQTFPINNVQICKNCCNLQSKQFIEQMIQTEPQLNINVQLGSGIVYQTDKMMLKQELDNKNKKYNVLKKLCHSRAEKIHKLEEELDAYKINLQNCNNGDDVLNKCSGSDKENATVLKPKQNGNDQCNTQELYYKPADIDEELRLQKIIEEMEDEISELKAQHEEEAKKLKEKYVALKNHCLIQKETIDLLKKK